MRHIICILFIIAVLFTVSGCAPSGYINATDGDITVSLPEKTDENNFIMPEEAKVLLGKWNLDSITVDGNEVFYENSYYIFYDDGNVTMKVSEQKDGKKFEFKENVLYIANNPVTYTVENDTLTITTQENKTHKLTKIAE